MRFVFAGADRDVPEAFRLRVGDRLAFEWPFDQAFAALVTSGPSTQAARSRAARPSRRTTKRR